MRFDNELCLPANAADLSLLKVISKQTGAEPGQAPLKLRLGVPSIKICCIRLVYKRHLMASLNATPPYKPRTHKNNLRTFDPIYN